MKVNIDGVMHNVYINQLLLLEIRNKLIGLGDLKDYKYDCFFSKDNFDLNTILKNSENKGYSDISNVKVEDDILVNNDRLIDEYIEFCFDELFLHSNQSIAEITRESFNGYFNCSDDKVINKLIRRIRRKLSEYESTYCRISRANSNFLDTNEYKTYRKLYENELRKIFEDTDLVSRVSFDYKKMKYPKGVYLIDDLLNKFSFDSLKNVIKYCDNIGSDAFDFDTKELKEILKRIDECYLIEPVDEDTKTSVNVLKK